MYEYTHRDPSERSVVTVFLPGAVQTDYEILEKGMSFVEHREPDDVDPLVRYVVQLKKGELLWDGRKADAADLCGNAYSSVTYLTY